MLEQYKEHELIKKHKRAVKALLEAGASFEVIEELYTSNKRAIVIIFKDGFFGSGDMFYNDAARLIKYGKGNGTCNEILNLLVKLQEEDNKRAYRECRFHSSYIVDIFRNKKSVFYYIENKLFTAEQFINLGIKFAQEKDLRTEYYQEILDGNLILKLLITSKATPTRIYELGMQNVMLLSAILMNLNQASALMMADVRNDGKSFKFEQLVSFGGSESGLLYTLLRNYKGALGLLSHKQMNAPLILNLGLGCTKEAFENALKNYQSIHTLLDAGISWSVICKIAQEHGGYKEQFCAILQYPEATIQLMCGKPQSGIRGLSLLDEILFFGKRTILSGYGNPPTLKDLHVFLQHYQNAWWYLEQKYFTWQTLYDLVVKNFSAFKSLISYRSAVEKLIALELAFQFIYDIEVQITRKHCLLSRIDDVLALVNGTVIQKVAPVPLQEIIRLYKRNSYVLSNILEYKEVACEYSISGIATLDELVKIGEKVGLLGYLEYPHVVHCLLSLNVKLHDIGTCSHYLRNVSNRLNIIYYLLSNGHSVDKIGEVIYCRDSSLYTSAQFYTFIEDKDKDKNIDFEKLAAFLSRFVYQAHERKYRPFENIIYNFELFDHYEHKVLPEAMKAVERMQNSEEQTKCENQPSKSVWRCSVL